MVVLQLSFCFLLILQNAVLGFHLPRAKARIFPSLHNPQLDARGIHSKMFPIIQRSVQPLSPRAAMSVPIDGVSAAALVAA